MAGDVLGAGQTDGLPLVGFVVAGGVYRPAVLRLTRAADTVESFQGEAGRVNQAVAAHAAPVARDVGDLFAHSHVRVELVVFEHDGFGRRLELAAQHPACHEHSPMDRRGGVVVGKQRQQVRVGEQPGPFLLIKPSGGKLPGVGHPLGSVKLGQALAERQIVGCEQFPEVRAGALPDYVVDEQVQRCAQISFERIVVARENLGILGDACGCIDSDPVMKCTA